MGLDVDGWETCRVFEESIVVLLESVDLEEVVVSAG